MLNVEPIKLLSGSHADTGATGQGCFMNVIAYLNGEPQITDDSPCVCVSVKRIAIWINDYLKDGERERLIPYIERAMGSATDDKVEIRRRVCLAVDMANTCAAIAKRYKSPRGAAAAAAAAAADAAAYAAAYAAAAAAAAYDAAAYAAADARKEIIEACFTFLDAALPKAPAEQVPIVVERAQKLLELVK
jgi:hypothetical protein